MLKRHIPYGPDRFADDWLSPVISSASLKYSYLLSLGKRGRYAA